MDLRLTAQAVFGRPAGLVSCLWREHVLYALLSAGLTWPVIGRFTTHVSFPFWLWGPEVAYKGVVLISFEDGVDKTQ